MQTNSTCSTIAESTTNCFHWCTMSFLEQLQHTWLNPLSSVVTVLIPSSFSVQGRLRITTFIWHTLPTFLSVLLNQLPQHIRSSNTCTSFSCSLKKHLFSVSFSCATSPAIATVCVTVTFSCLQFVLVWSVIANPLRFELIWRVNAMTI